MGDQVIALLKSWVMALVGGFGLLKWWSVMNSDWQSSQ